MSDNVENTLGELFEKHRVIFWYDEKEELRERYEAVELQDVNKLEVAHNQFYAKHLITREDTLGKFLLYIPHARPDHKDNWLLDLELASYEFRTDEEAIFLQEIDLTYDYKDLVSDHLEFFKSKERKQKLKDLLMPDDSFREIRYKMLAVVFNAPSISLASYIQSYANLFIKQDDQINKELERFNLTHFYWKEIANNYKYNAQDPGIYDFMVEVFSNVFSLTKKSGLSKDAVLLISSWKDTISYQEAFKVLSDRIAEDLKVESQLSSSSIEEVVNDDIFKIIDYKIIRDLIEALVEETISYDRLSKIIKTRENKYWYEHFSDFYACLEHGAELLNTVKEYQDFNFESFESGTRVYSEKLYKVDFHYRKFIYYYRKKNQDKALESLYQKIDRVYSNDWLLVTNDKWQEIIDKTENWPQPMGKSQANFFRDHVQPILDKDQRLFVVVSDALRYECGHEFFDLINRKNRYDGDIGYLISSLPSYTQLGMASLLPHNVLTIQPETDQVLADGIPTQGIQGRNKVLESNTLKRSVAISAVDFMKMNSSKEGREFAKNYDLIYIFHNQIDKTGDDKISEDKVFEATERELQYLVDVLKRIANMNGTNMIVTSDHGFIYQDRPLDESDFIKAEVQGNIWKENRRFFIGEQLKSNNTLRHFKAKELHLEGDFDILIPKSINRHRVKGAGSRYVHGGASLQEIIIPILKVTKKKRNTVRQVEVDIIKQNNRITTNILTVSFLQTELVDENVLPRTIRASVVAPNEEILSDQFTFTFDFTESSERLREVKHQFQMSSKASTHHKNKTVKLLLEEQVEGTSKWIPYKEYAYELNISFSADFDDLG